MIGLIDLEISNVQSVVRAFERASLTVERVNTPDDVRRASALILPGVGAFAEGMATLERKGLVEPIRHAATAERKPVFGICLGMQLLADDSEENGLNAGLGLIRGHVRRLQPTDPRYRVPNVGWCDVTAPRPGALFPAGPQPAFYFVHSYHLVCEDAGDVAATIDFSGQSIVAAIERGNIFGAQFHPEKSQDAGIDLLARYAAHLTSQGHIN